MLLSFNAQAKKAVETEMGVGVMGLEKNLFCFLPSVNHIVKDFLLWHLFVRIYTFFLHIIWSTLNYHCNVNNGELVNKKLA